MDISKDRFIAIGKEKIKATGLTDKDEASFMRRVLRKFGAGKWFIINSTSTRCLICAIPLKPNNQRQIIKYCSKTCRHKRHNAKR